MIIMFVALFITIALFGVALSVLHKNQTLADLLGTFAILVFTAGLIGGLVLEAKLPHATLYEGEDPSGHTCKWDFMTTGDAIGRCEKQLGCIYTKENHTVVCSARVPAEAP